MIISEEEKNRIRNLHREYFILNEQGLGGIASIGSGFVNKQGSSERASKFLKSQAELGDGYYDFGELELDEQEKEPLPDDDDESTKTQEKEPLPDDDESTI